MAAVDVELMVARDACVDAAKQVFWPRVSVHAERRRDLKGQWRYVQGLGVSVVPPEMYTKDGCR